MKRRSRWDDDVSDFTAATFTDPCIAMDATVPFSRLWSAVTFRFAAIARHQTCFSEYAGEERLLRRLKRHGGKCSSESSFISERGIAFRPEGPMSTLAGV